MFGDTHDALTRARYILHRLLSVYGHGQPNGLLVLLTRIYIIALTLNTIQLLTGEKYLLAACCRELLKLSHDRG